MTKTAKMWAVVVSALLAVVIVLLIVLVVQGANAKREAALDECAAEYPPSSQAYWLCVELVD